MKKNIILTLLVAALLTISACTIQIPAANIEQTNQVTQNPANAAQSNDSASQNTDNKADETHKAATPTPEPTQEFVNNENNVTAHPTDRLVKHDEMLGLWMLVVWEDVNVDSGDMVFYEITTGMMNVSTYTNTPAYGDFNYTYNNGDIDFGNGAYQVILDQGVLVFSSRSTGKIAAFQPMTEQEIKNMVGSSSNTDTSQWEIVTPEPVGTTMEIIPTGPSNRTGYPFHNDELVYDVPEENLLGELTGKTWRTYGYQWSDGTIVHDFAMYNEWLFSGDYSFSHQHSFGTSTGLYEIYGVGLELFYSDGTMKYFPEVFIVQNQTNGYSYLYMVDTEEGYEGCYTIYEGY